MKNDILLVFCPPFDVKEPPLGLAYLAENLSAHGWQVCVEDLNIAFYLSNSDRRFLWEGATSYDISLLQYFEDDIAFASQRIAASGVPVVGFSVNQYNLPISVAVARQIKRIKRDIIILFGGPECFLKSDRDCIPSDALDYFVVGDGELIVNNFLSCFVRGGCLETIEGVIPVGANRELPYNQKIYPLQQHLIMPRFRSFELSRYPGGSLPVIFTRGCVRQCVFCGDQSYRKPFSCADPFAFVDALEFYIQEYGIRNFSFHDQAINSNPSALKSFLKEVIRRELAIYWSSNMMVRGDLDRDLFDMMKSAGCQNLIFGVESFSDNVLFRMNKGFSVEDARRALVACADSGIEVLINLIVGFPGEGSEDVDATIAFLAKNRTVITGVLNLSTCLVAPLSDLERRPDDFSIVLPKNHFSNWFTMDGRNTKEARMALAMRIKEILAEFAIPLKTLNIMNDERICSKLNERLE